MRTGKQMMVRVAGWGAASALMAGVVQAQETYQPQNLRYDDNTAALRDGDGPAFKYIALGQDGAAYLSVGGQARVRLEGWENFGFSPDNDDV